MIKVILCGDGSVGKTEIKTRFVGETDRPSYLMTAAADFSSKEIVTERSLVQLQIWDLSGQPQYSEIRKAFFKGAHIAIVVFDLTQDKSFEHVPAWINELFSSLGSQIPVILVGNKTDLREVQVEGLGPSLGQKLANELSEQYYNQAYSIPYIEVSAVEGYNISKVFETAAVVAQRLEAPLCCARKKKLKTQRMN